MKKTPLKRGTSQLKRSGFKPKKGTKLRITGISEVSVLKREIQRLVREIVILRDKGCVLRNIRHCGGEVGEAVLQADHLITRGHSATYADTRLIVCICRPCHGGFKKWHKEEYDALIRTVISKERVKLWDRCEEDSWRAKRVGANDWKLYIVALEQELSKYN